MIHTDWNSAERTIRRCVTLSQIDLDAHREKIEFLKSRNRMTRLEGDSGCCNVDEVEYKTVSTKIWQKKFCIVCPKKHRKDE